MDPLLPTLIAEIVVDLPDSRSVSTDCTITWTRAGRPFAVLGPEGIELRLDLAIAAAASRTPNTALSPRGPEWVCFNPLDLDGHAIDRLRAWFELAYRRAAD